MNERSSLQMFKKNIKRPLTVIPRELHEMVDDLVGLNEGEKEQLLEDLAGLDDERREKWLRDFEGFRKKFD
jgi:hypothetical protein